MKAEHKLQPQVIFRHSDTLSVRNHLLSIDPTEIDPGKIEAYWEKARESLEKRLKNLDSPLRRITGHGTLKGRRVVRDAKRSRLTERLRTQEALKFLADRKIRLVRYLMDPARDEIVGFEVISPD